MARIIENPEQLILSKAKEILYNEGYGKLSMRALSKACNIALGTIYNYYPTKKDLVIKMMSEYWHEYLISVKKIVDSESNIYIKLNDIFEELKLFIKSFRQYWLTEDLYKSPEYKENTFKEEDIFMEKLIVIVQKMLEKEALDNKINLKLGSYETSSFIIMNFIGMVQVPFFKYDSFELFLKELFH